MPSTASWMQQSFRAQTAAQKHFNPTKLNKSVRKWFKQKKWEQQKITNYQAEFQMLAKIAKSGTGLGRRFTLKCPCDWAGQRFSAQFVPQRRGCYSEKSDYLETLLVFLLEMCHLSFLINPNLENIRYLRWVQRSLRSLEYSWCD